MSNQPVQPITVAGSGIKCDNNDCDFTDDSVTFEQLHDWLNKPCPECGENLLTKEDFEAVNTMHMLMDAVNGNPEAFGIDVTNRTAEPMTIRSEFDGSGVPKFSVVESDNE